jgi:hypothetical protein
MVDTDLLGFKNNACAHEDGPRNIKPLPEQAKDLRRDLAPRAYLGAYVCGFGTRDPLEMGTAPDRGASLDGSLLWSRRDQLVMSGIHAGPHTQPRRDSRRPKFATAPGRVACIVKDESPGDPPGAGRPSSRNPSDGACVRRTNPSGCTSRMDV